MEVKLTETGKSISEYVFAVRLNGGGEAEHQHNPKTITVI